MNHDERLLKISDQTLVLWKGAKTQELLFVAFSRLHVVSNLIVSETSSVAPF